MPFCPRESAFICLFIIMQSLQCKQQREDWHVKVVVTCVCVTHSEKEGNHSILQNYPLVWLDQYRGDYGGAK